VTFFSPISKRGLSAQYGEAASDAAREREAQTWCEGLARATPAKKSGSDPDFQASAASTGIPRTRAYTGVKSGAVSRMSCAKESMTK
jgi:hypothetical protein